LKIKFDPELILGKDLWPVERVRQRQQQQQPYLRRGSELFSRGFLRLSLPLEFKVILII
jgi:hypothetical protein